MSSIVSYSFPMIKDNRSGLSENEARRKAIGSLVKELRLKRGFTQAQLAELAGVAQPTIGKIEAGQYDTRFSTLESISNACGLAVTDMLGQREAVKNEDVEDWLASNAADEMDITLREAEWLRSIDSLRWHGRQPGPAAFGVLIGAFRASKGK